jgi:uncharacterized protein
VMLLDTTILVYALGADHRLRAPCRSLLTLIRDDAVRATTTPEVLQEFTHVRARRRSRKDAAQLAREYARGFAPLAVIDEEDLLEGLDLFERTASLGAFDAVLAATAVRRGWSLASADRSFGQVRRLHWLDPSSPDFLSAAESAS